MAVLLRSPNFSVEGELVLEIRAEIKNYSPGNGLPRENPEAEGVYYDIDSVYVKIPYYNKNGKVSYKEIELPGEIWGHYLEEIDALVLD